MKKKSCFLFIVVFVILSLAACERVDRALNLQEPLFSDVKVPVEFSTIRFFVSEDIVVETDNGSVSLHYSSDLLPIAEFRSGGTRRTALTEVAKDRVFILMGDTLRYRGNPLVWSDIKSMNVNGFTIYYAETMFDSSSFVDGIFHFLYARQRTSLTLGMFLADENLYIVSFAAPARGHSLYLPHFIAQLNTIESTIPGIDLKGTRPVGQREFTHPEELIGQWVSNDTLLPLSYVFKEDGIGMIVGALNSFYISWATVGNELITCGNHDLCCFDPAKPIEWYFSVENNVLSLTRKPESSQTFTFNRRLVRE